MFLLFMISLSVIVYFICMEINKPVTPLSPPSGHCQVCSQSVESGWLVCPNCRSVLREVCSDCGKVHDRWVNFCPWCGQQNQKAVS
ncbi:MAG: double zinc ribbon domain-containing protein [Desulfuromonadales bacterium]